MHGMVAHPYPHHLPTYTYMVHPCPHHLPRTRIHTHARTHAIVYVYPDPALGRADNVVKYVEAYSEEISTLYSQVWWTMGPIYNFSKDFIREYSNKTMAIVGYEFDQVIANPDGTESPVPVTWSYNHHYSARVVGKYADMYRQPVDGPSDPLWRHAGHLSGPYQGKAASIWLANSTENDPTPNSSIPTIVDFDEANGGEWRKSFHGYPHGYAQMVENPIGFRSVKDRVRVRVRVRSVKDRVRVSVRSVKDNALFTCTACCLLCVVCCVRVLSARARARLCDCATVRVRVLHARVCACACARVCVRLCVRVRVRVHVPTLALLGCAISHTTSLCCPLLL